MPSDSQFAIAMKNQQEADRAEQQRIKNLVLNYDLQGSSTEQSGTDNNLYFDCFSHPNPNFLYESTNTHSGSYQGFAGERHQHNASLHQASPGNTGARPPADNSGANRSGQRARKLQLSDVDWYDQRSHSSRSPRQRLARGQRHGSNRGTTG